MVELIMDAKFKYKIEDALAIDQIHAFIQRVNALQTQKAAFILVKFDNLTKIKSNCLLTNGRVLENHRQYCINNKIMQVGNFNRNLSEMSIIG